MPEKNIEIEIYSRIWELLEASAKFKEMVPVGNRIKLANLSGGDDPDKSIVADGDMCEARLDVLNGKVNLYTGTVTFETHAPGGPGDWMERHEYVFRLQTKSQVLDLNEITMLGAVSRNAIRLGGPRLGLSYITDVTIQFNKLDRRARQDLGLDDRPREVVNTDIQIIAEIDGSEM